VESLAGSAVARLDGQPVEHRRVECGHAGAIGVHGNFSGVRGTLKAPRDRSQAPRAQAAQIILHILTGRIGIHGADQQETAARFAGLAIDFHGLAKQGLDGGTGGRLFGERLHHGSAKGPAIQLHGFPEQAFLGAESRVKTRRRDAAHGLLEIDQGSALVAERPEYVYRPLEGFFAIETARAASLRHDHPFRRTPLPRGRGSVKTHCGSVKRI